jgi:hypothetical protein
VSEDTIQVGDILEWADNMGEPHRWRVNGVHLGAQGQESLIMESVTHKPGWTGEWEFHPIVWVPEVLCRRLRKVEP